MPQLPSVDTATFQKTGIKAQAKQQAQAKKESQQKAKEQAKQAAKAKKQAQQAQSQETAQNRLFQQKQALILSAAWMNWYQEIGWDTGSPEASIEEQYQADLGAVPFSADDWLVKAKPQCKLEYDQYGNLVVEVNLTDKQADMLNLVVSGLGMKKQGKNFLLVPAELPTLSNAQKGELNWLTTEAYIEPVKGGYILTEKGFNLLGFTYSEAMETMKAHFLSAS